MGISNEQLVENIANRLRAEITQIVAVPWPPQVIELEQQEEVSPLLVQLISSLKRSSQVESDIKAHTLASLLSYYVTSKPTITSINLGMNMHGLTRGKELVDTFHKVGVCIGYLQVLLRDAWAVHDLQLNKVCPNEIAEDTPAVVTVGNDDFQNDTLIGGGTSHRTKRNVCPASLLGILQSSIW